MKRILLGGLVVGLVVGGSVHGLAQVTAGPGAGSGEATSPVAGRSKALAGLLDEIWQDRLRHDPEFASSIGDKRYNDRLSDRSAQEVNASLARGRGYLQRISEIDTTGLSEQERLSADLMIRGLVDDQEGARFKEWEMPVNQFNGFQLDLPALVNDLTFETVKDYDDYIARLKKVPVAFQQTMTNMQLGADEGRVPPAYLMEKVLAQVEGLASEKAAESAFALPLKKFPKTVGVAEQKRISGEVLEAIGTDVLPWYTRFGKFLKAEYIPKSRKEPGVSAIPDGDAYYAYRVRQSTTLDKTPAEIHQIGLDEVKRDEAAMLVIVKQLGFSDIKSFGVAMKADPKQHPQSKEQLLGLYRKYEDQMRPRLPELFGRLPKAALVVAAMPEFREKASSAALYMEGTADGSRPGRVDVNTYNFAERALAPVETVAYHEGLPGHHLQIATAQELTGLATFRKYTYYTAYTEGWALYSERLGKEIGFYQDPYSDYGRLEADMWRAIRLVVDTGVHAQHWTRQQMVDYFHEHSAIDETNVQAEVDRYIAWPGQALGYKMGQMKILELRARAQQKLGAKFDLKAFHDLVLGSGAVPMDVLELRVDGWIAGQSGAKGRG